ncbi:hypothetical protein [Saccharopolyspora thermophila]|nr:hypothetical protein [Saccharopolyspora subtropica]
MQRWNDISAERLCAELLPFFEAGWCVDAVVAALHRRPDGTPQMQVRTSSRVDLVRYWLRQWRGPAGSPLRPPVEPSTDTGSVAVADDQRAPLHLLQRRKWPSSVVPETPDQTRAAVRALAESMRWSGVTDHELLELVAPFFGAGWSVDCLRHAMTTSGVTRQPAAAPAGSGADLVDQIRRRLATWASKRGYPKRPPKETLRYDDWFGKQQALGTFDVRERRPGPSRVQLEVVRQVRRLDEDRRRRRHQDRVATARWHDRKAQQSLDALAALLPPDSRGRPAADEAPDPKTRHERLAEGIFYLEATDTALVRWLRSLAEMDLADIGPEAAKVTRLRMRDARERASLAALEQMGAAGEELSEVARALADYVSGAADLEAGHEVRDMWQQLRKAFKAHDRTRR